MTAQLIPCARCERHVRADELACPFCSEPLPRSAARRDALRPLPAGRLGSLALMTFRAAALGAVLTACGGDSDDDDDSETAGRGGAPAQAGTGAGGSGDNPAGSSSGGSSGAGTEGGGPSFGGGPGGGGGPVPIYRATPRG